MIIETRTDIDDEGTPYISCDLLTVGDYGGAGDVGEANIRALKKQFPDAVEEEGAYGFSQLWLPCNEETLEALEALADYPLVDDEELYRVQVEWQQEAWNDYGWEDAVDDCGEAYKILRQEDCISKEDATEALMLLDEEKGANWVYEYNQAIFRTRPEVFVKYLHKAKDWLPVDLNSGEAGILLDWLADAGREEEAALLRELLLPSE